MTEIIENKLTVEQYLNFRKQVGWDEKTYVQAEMTLKNSLYTLCAYYDGRPAAMGRIVGDGASICYVQDLIVIPEEQGHHLGTAVLNKLQEYVKSITMEGTVMRLCLMCAKGREEFYIKNGFISRPNDDFGPGMISFIEK